MECDYCHEELKALRREAPYLSSNEEVLALAAQHITAGNADKSFSRRLWEYLWPQVPLLFRPAISYLAVLALVLVGPWIARLTMQPTASPAAPMVALSAHRGANHVEELSKEAGRSYNVGFHVPRTEANLIYSVVIRRVGGETVKRFDQFTEYSSDGNASVSIDPATLP